METFYFPASELLKGGSLVLDMGDIGESPTLDGDLSEESIEAAYGWVDDYRTAALVHPIAHDLLIRAQVLC